MDDARQHRVKSLKSAYEARMPGTCIVVVAEEIVTVYKPAV